MEKQKFKLEFSMRSVPIPLLWSYISSASGLKEWFADKVTVSGKTYTFEWNGQQQSATVLGIRNEQSIRFRWDDSNGKDYFEMRISVNELTDSTTLAVVDFAEAEETDDAKELWETQVDTLRRVLGC
ncbi:MAG: SRPBCC domain-containing protein [Candidatus Homeothermus sp.]|nr:SRPBCC domain-containing protein [Candidatus Homeothermus sp.]